jgi:hypothetical protein
MPTGYPYTLDSLGSVQDNVDMVLATHVNSLRRLVEALETKVGVNNSSDSNSLDYKVRNIPAPSPPVDLYGPPAWTVNAGQVGIQLRTAAGQPQMDFRSVKLWVCLDDNDPDPAGVQSAVSDVSVTGAGTQLSSNSTYVLDLVTDATGALDIYVTMSSGASVYVWLAVGTQVFVSPDIQVEQN